jgi:endoglucanase
VLVALLAALAWVVTLLLIAPPGQLSGTTIAATGTLHVEGKRLIGAGGQTVVLHGVNRSGTEAACVNGWGIFDGPNDAASVAAIASWHANAVRIPLNEDCWLGINDVLPEFSGAAYRDAVASYVRLVTDSGLYAILDLHWSAPGLTLAKGQAPMPDADHSIAFWSDVAATFADDDAVIFDLYNEPWPDDQRDSTAAWRCWRDGGVCPGVTYQAVGMQALVDAVRATGASNVIALSGVSYGNTLTQWLAYAPHDPLGNLIASWHVYDFNVCSATSCYGTTAASVAAQVPIVASEIGTSSCDAAFLGTLMDWLDAHKDGYLAWTWNTWGADCALISLVSDYQGTPTAYGAIYQAHLASLN